MRKEYDKEYFEDKTCWVAELSNGESIYQDDKNQTSTWKELKKYVIENNLLINKIYVRFRSNIIYPLDENSDGYFFSVGIIAMMTSSKNINFYLLGSIKNNNVRIIKIKVPELIIFEEEDRSILDCKDEQLILNLKGHQWQKTDQSIANINQDMVVDG